MPECSQNIPVLLVWKPNMQFRGYSINIEECLSAAKITSYFQNRIYPRKNWQETLLQSPLPQKHTAEDLGLRWPRGWFGHSTHHKFNSHSDGYLPRNCAGTPHKSRAGILESILQPALPWWRCSLLWQIIPAIPAASMFPFRPLMICLLWLVWGRLPLGCCRWTSLEALWRLQDIAFCSWRCLSCIRQHLEVQSQSDPQPRTLRASPWPVGLWHAGTSRAKRNWKGCWQSRSNFGQNPWIHSRSN